MKSTPGYYPICLSLKGQPCLVVGGGTVAEHKTKVLLQYGAKVSVVSPTLTPQLRRWAQARRITARRRAFRDSDVRGQWLVHGATDDTKAQRAIYQAARRARVWVNIVDVPSLCTFIAPAQVKRGDLTIAVSTGGRAPAVAKYVRQEIERLIGAEYAELLQLIAELRPRVQRAVPVVAERGDVMARIIRSGVMDALRNGDLDAARNRATELLEEFERAEET